MLSFGDCRVAGPVASIPIAILVGLDGVLTPPNGWLLLHRPSISGVRSRLPQIAGVGWLTSFVLTDFGGAESRGIMGSSDKGRPRRFGRVRSPWCRLSKGAATGPSPREDD